MKRTVRVVRLVGILLTGQMAVIADEQYGDFRCVSDGTNVTITGYTGPGGDVQIPDSITNLPVTTIGSWAFYSCSSLTRVTIGNSVTTIGNDAFAR